MSLSVRNDAFSALNSWAFDPSSQVAQSLGDAKRAAIAAVQDALVDSSGQPAEAQAAELFKQQFGDLAQDSQAFHAMMKKVYGENYDASKAEQYRQMALTGDYSFLPPVTFVSRETLHGGNGAYDDAEGVLYLAEDLKNDPAKMQSIYVEEAGHHLDAMLNTGDTRGDEGELLRRLLSGEKLSDGTIEAIRRDNDHGTIIVDGKAVHVEFNLWDDATDFVSDAADTAGNVVNAGAEIVGDAVNAGEEFVGNAVDAGREFVDGAVDQVVETAGNAAVLVRDWTAQAVDAVGDAAEDVRDAVDGAARRASRWIRGAVEDIRNFASDAIDYAGNVVRDVTYSIGDAIKEGGMGLINSVEMFMQGAVVDVFGGAFMNLLQGRPVDAWDSILNGLDKMVIQAPRRFVNGMLEGAGHLLKTPTYILPENVGGKFVREVVDRSVDSVRSVVNGAIDIGRNFFRLPFEVIIGFGRDIGESLRYFARGDIGEGFERFGLAFANPFKRIGGAVVDSAMIAGQAGVNVVGNMLGLHHPSRGLSKAERDYLKSIYGDSINLEDIRIHHGNLTHDMGMAPHCVGNDIYLPDDRFNADGSLNQRGQFTLVHEAFHVYQAQHGGNDYIHNALLANLGGIVNNGNRNAGYNWTIPLQQGLPFREWNAEQQGALIETIARARDQRFGPDLTGPAGMPDGIPDNSYDANNDDIIQRTELELAWADTNRNGTVDTGDADGDGQPDETLVTLTDEQFNAVMAIWAAIKDNRPDRAVI